MTALIENPTPTLNRETILQSFLADAEADTAAVVSVTELLAKCHALKDELVSAHEQLVAAHAAATKRPNVAAKLRELGVKIPSTMTVELGGTSARKRRPSRKTRSRSAPQDSSPPVNALASDEPGTGSMSE